MSFVPLSGVPASPSHERVTPPDLPLPTRTRWQPLRLGLVELFHYDAEEFWFRDGHLLLRGNNGTGKSKVLSLTLPFLLDASLSASRVEPDGDRSKRMEWNLLMGRYERRLGYSWVEFGRLDEDGRALFVTLGCGMSAVSGRSRVDSWNFLSDQRVGAELLLISPERTALSRERLLLALDGRGQVFDTARDYRRAVDTRLFRLGERYDGLIDTLIQLRQPQLSKKPDEESLSRALGNALPELPRVVLDDVAEAMNQLDVFRDELFQIERVRTAVADFGKRYRVYAQIQARRQARTVRRAQTDFDKQSQALNEARAQLERAGTEEQARKLQAEALDEQLRRDRSALDELRSDPAMQDARRLEDLEATTRERERAHQSAIASTAHAEHKVAREQLERERRESEQGSTTAATAALADQARVQAELAGILGEHEQRVQPLIAEDAELVRAATLRDELAALVGRRRAQLEQVRALLRSCEQAERARELVQSRCRDRRGALDAAETAARAANDALGQSADGLLRAWESYLEGLQVLFVREPDVGLAELADWVHSLLGEHPLRNLVDQAHAEAQARLAAEQSGLDERKARLDATDDELSREQELLLGGQQLAPAPLTVRQYEGRTARAGAPLWQLLEFRDHVSSEQRAGLEAALEGAGLLDAWVSPDAHVLLSEADDAWLLPGAPRAASLRDWLEPGPSEAVAHERIEALLASVAVGERDEPEADSWLSPAGEFRLGRLRGAYHKTQAQYLGRAAREASRQRRLAELATLRAGIAAERERAAEEAADLQRRTALLQRELRGAPKDDGLRAAHARLDSLESVRREAQVALAAAESELQQTIALLLTAHSRLEQDARDLRLSTVPDELLVTERALQDYRAHAAALVAAFEAQTRAASELKRQQARELQAREELSSTQQLLLERARERDDARARRDLLKGMVGAAVDALQRKLAAVMAAVAQGEQSLEGARASLSQAQQERARFEERSAAERALLDERTAARTGAVAQLHGFARTGLLAVAAPELQQPDEDSWTIDPALNLARRIEALLTRVSAEDHDWTRVQSDIARDFTSLGQGLSALGQRASMETTDFGLLVQVVYNNRAERPDVLELRLASEVEQRRGILSAREREVLENHLQAEVAAYLQRLLREAEERVARINDELKRRPTSTGVFFRVDWETLPEGDEGAPVGLALARARLLRQSADAWSAEDRKVVGEFLQSRIESERTKSDSGSLVEHLARALDYRRWHRFRVKRWHDGAFRPLSGPASSGERALGLTVPLFAAASSYYESGATHEAPRLVLLDEAFAGIDDEARSHCMALIREFDLDFVMTSEREWGCYATLPGVAICQISRREGIDAVFVSRWSWDGRSKRSEPDPDRRFQTAEHREH